MNSSRLSEVRSIAVMIASVVAAVAVVSNGALADVVSSLITFTAGDSARAADVNANFNAVAAKADELDLRIDSGFDFDSSNNTTISTSDTSSTITETVTISVPGPGWVTLDWVAYGHLSGHANNFMVCRIRSGTSDGVNTGGLTPGYTYRENFDETLSANSYFTMATSAYHEYTGATAATLTFSTACYRRALAGYLGGLSQSSLKAVYHRNRL